MNAAAFPKEFQTTSDVAQMLERVKSLQDLIKSHAAEGEKNRRVPDEVINALAEAGAFKLALPRRFGGYQSSMKNMLDLSAIVGEADGGTAWVLTLTNVCGWLLGLYPEQAQKDVLGANPEARIAGVLAPTSTAERVEGGLKVSGKWFYNSGSWHADWAMLGVPVVNEAGETIDQGLALIPRSELGFQETWFVAGMCSSGSNCLIAEDVIVPDHRILSIPKAIEGDYPTEFKDQESFYRAAFVPVLALVLVGPQLGLGRAALDFVIGKSKKKPISYTFMEDQAHSVGFQLQIAEAAQMIDSAHLHAYRAAADIDSAAEAGTYLSREVRARVRADVGLVADKVSKAIDILLSAHGAGSFAQVSPLQRIWRDSAVAARHAVVCTQVSQEVYGKSLLGVEEQITPLI